MSDEIDEFIRRAAEKRRQAQGQRKPARPAPIASPAPTPVRRLAPEIVEAEIVEDVSAHVARSVNTAAYDQRASRLLDDDVDQADDRVEARLQKTFDHKLGRLSQIDSTEKGSAPTTRSATDAAAQVTTTDANPMLSFLVQSFGSPQSIRQAVILSDILTRPEHRW